MASTFHTVQFAKNQSTQHPQRELQTSSAMRGFLTAFLTFWRLREKITNFWPPEIPQSSRFPMYPELRLRPDLVDCDAIFWIAESIVGM